MSFCQGYSLMLITRRQISLGLIGLFILATLTVVLIDVSAGTITTLTYIDIFVLLIFGTLFWATRRGWPYATYSLVVVMILLVAGLIEEPYLTQQVGLGLLTPAITALVLTGPRWIFGSAVATLAIILMRAGWQGAYTETFNLITYSISVAGLILGRLVATSATRMADEARAEAEAASLALQTSNATLEQRVAQRTAEVQSALAEVEARAAEQMRLLEENQRQQDVISRLSVPVLPIGDATLVMPLVGVLDSNRMGLLQTQALQHIERQRAQLLLLDVTGVPVIDSQIGQGLVGVMQAARLLGAQVALVGIRPEVAQTIVGLGLQLDGVRSFASLADGLRQLGRKSA